MQSIALTDSLSWVGAIDWDRKTFDELVPLPDGTSYNAYLVRGSEKTALIDTVDPSMAHVFWSRLEHAGPRRLDFVVSNHAEQDHSGLIPEVLSRYPEAQVLSTAKGKTMLVEHLAIPEDRIRAIQDKESVSLGNLSLQFIQFPWVHWPETMLTWIPQTKTLFSCDLFGSHWASSDLFATDEAAVVGAAQRYYAEIMMPLRSSIEKNMSKLDALDIEWIAPSHGPIYNRPSVIQDAYRSWVCGPAKNRVVVAFVSMHQSTRRMVDHLVDALQARQVPVQPFNVAEFDAGKFAVELIDAMTLVFGSPLVLGGPHPKVASSAYLANLLKPKAKFISVVGSMGWGGKMVEALLELVPNLKCELLEPVMARGLPREEDFNALDRLADLVSEKHNAALAAM